MTVVALLGGKHSPGASTLALALTALAPNDQLPVLVEADPHGGDLAARAGLPLDPGLLTLAAAGRRGGVSPEALEAHSQLLACGARVLLGPVSPDHAHAAVTGLARPLGSFLGSQPGLGIVDVGRWDSRSPATELLCAADVVLAVFRPTVEGVEHIRARLGTLHSAGRVLAVAIGERPYSAVEVQAALGGVELHVVEDDARAAQAVAGGAPVDRWLRRSALLRSVTSLRDAIFAAVAEEVAEV